MKRRAGVVTGPVRLGGMTRTAHHGARQSRLPLFRARVCGASFLRGRNFGRRRSVGPQGAIMRGPITVTRLSIPTPLMGGLVAAALLLGACNNQYPPPPPVPGQPLTSAQKHQLDLEKAQANTDSRHQDRPCRLKSCN
jgi:hypothetical protein